MAFRCSPATSFTLVQKHVLTKKSSLSNNRLLMLAQPSNHFTISTTSIFTKPSLDNKVYEDPSNGIICYRDENGEMICEGYDEGPRLNKQQLTRLICSNSNDNKILDMLERSLLQTTATRLSALTNLTSCDDCK